MMTLPIGIIADLGHYSARIRLEAFARHAHGLGWRLRFFEQPGEVMPLIAEHAFTGLFICNIDPVTGFHEALRQLGPRVPVVEASRKTLTPWPQVFMDEDRVARMALGHLRWQQRVSYGYLGRAEAASSLEREAAFARVLREEEDGPKHLKSRHLDMETPGSVRRQLAEFLSEFPRPGCLLCFEDRIAELALEECDRQGLRVPEDVAVLSCGDDPLLTSLGEAALSCIVFPSEEIGRASAQLLDRLIRGEDAKISVQRVPPTELRIRDSTDPAASSDLVLGRAIGFIRQHLAEAISVGDVAVAAGVSRRALETRFRRKLQKSVHEQIQELRMEKATGLIRATDQKIEDIAVACGFSSAATFSRAYRAHRGVPPSAHR